MSDPAKNFAKCIVSGTYSSSDTAITLQAGEGSKLPAPSTDGAFNLVWWNYTDYPDPSGDPNKEIVRCTARTTDALTVTRAQESTSATSKNTSGKTYMMALSFTKSLYDYITGKLPVYAADAEASDSYVITPNPAFTAYTTGQVFNFKANTANTGACTLNVNSLGAKTIKKNVSDDLETGDILASKIVSVIYDGTNFQLISLPCYTTTKDGVQTMTNKTLTSPKVGTSINDTNGNEVIKTPATASAVNEVTVTNAATGNAPQVAATGDDTNIDLVLVGKGTGKVYATGIILAKGQAKQTSNVAVTSSQLDLTGATVDITVPTGYTATIIVTAVFDNSCDTVGNIFAGRLVIGGANQNGDALVQNYAVGARNTIAGTWAASLSAGTTTVKLAGARASGSGTGTFIADNTKFSYIVIIN